MTAKFGASMNRIWEARSTMRPKINGIRRDEYRSENKAIGIVAMKW
jgi:hypothetical protein